MDIARTNIDFILRKLAIYCRTSARGGDGRFCCFLFFRAGRADHVLLRKMTPNCVLYALKQDMKQ